MTNRCLQSSSNGDRYNNENDKKIVDRYIKIAKLNWILIKFQLVNFNSNKFIYDYD